MRLIHHSTISWTRLTKPHLLCQTNWEDHLQCRALLSLRTILLKWGSSNSLSKFSPSPNQCSKSIRTLCNNNNSYSSSNNSNSRSSHLLRSCSSKNQITQWWTSLSKTIFWTTDRVLRFNSGNRTTWANNVNSSSNKCHSLCKDQLLVKTNNSSSRLPSQSHLVEFHSQRSTHWWIQVPPQQPTPNPVALSHLRIWSNSLASKEQQLWLQRIPLFSLSQRGT